MKKVYSYVIGVIIIFVTIVTFSQGIINLFSSMQIFAQSLLIVIILNLLGVWALRSDKTSTILKESLIWKLRENTTYKMFALLFLLIIQLGILGFAYSPVGSEHKKLVILAVVIPSLLSSSLLVKLTCSIIRD